MAVMIVVLTIGFFKISFPSSFSLSLVKLANRLIISYYSDKYITEYHDYTQKYNRLKKGIISALCNFTRIKLFNYYYINFMTYN